MNIEDMYVIVVSKRRNEDCYVLMQVYDNLIAYIGKLLGDKSRGRSILEKEIDIVNELFIVLRLDQTKLE